MARALSEKTLEKILAKHDSAVISKTISQAKAGKDFVLDDGGHGPGVVPEGVWKSAKKGGEDGVADYIEGVA